MSALIHNLLLGALVAFSILLGAIFVRGGSESTSAKTAPVPTDWIVTGTGVSRDGQNATFRIEYTTPFSEKGVWSREAAPHTPEANKSIVTCWVLAVIGEPLPDCARREEH